MAQQHHPTLYWREGGSTGAWAVRSGDWKRVVEKGTKELFNLAQDPSKKTDLKAQQPERVAELTRRYDAWLEQMAEPMNGASKRYDAAGAESDRAKARKGKKGATPH